MGSRKFFQTKPNYVFPNNSADDDDDHNNNTFEFDEADMFNPTSNGSKAVMVNKKTNYNSCLSKLINSSSSSSSSFNKKINNNDHGNRTASSSLPVNVPDWSKILKKEDHHIKVTSDAIDQGFDDDDDDVDDDQNKWVPPHEYLAQRRGASFSVHEGRGRTLKGSDLSRVRNAIFEKMGFED